MSQRSFTSPSGRAWMASLVELPKMTPEVPVQEVLRFTSGELALDLYEWPSDWERFTEPALVQLVRQAQPPHLGFPGTRALQPRQ